MMGTRKRTVKWAVFKLAPLALLALILIACGTADLDANTNAVTDTDLSNDYNPVIDISSIDYQDGLVQLTTQATELLGNSTFDTNTHWYNCGDPVNSNMANGKLTLSGSSACVYQTVPAIANTDYQLTCDSTSSAVWSNVTLYTLDTNWSIIDGVTTQVTDTVAQPSVVADLTSAANTSYVAVTIYSEGPAIHESCSLTIVDNSTPVTPNPGYTDNEAALAVNNLLIDPTFDEGNAAWVNCAPANAQITGGSLELEPNSCFYQDVAIDIAAIAGGDIHLTCKGSTRFPTTPTGVAGVSEVAYSAFILTTLDANKFYLSLEDSQYISTTARQWRTSWNVAELEPTTEYLRLQFNGVSPATYEYCYLETKNVPALVPEVINPPSKPLGVISTLYTDPQSDPTAWNEFVTTTKASSDVEIMLVINPSNNDPFLLDSNPAKSIPLCDYGGYNPYMAELEAAGVETIGYVPVGFIANRYAVADVKANIDRYADCETLDGIFFDEVQILTEADAAYYKEICDYATLKYPNGNHILNVGSHPDYVVNKDSCSITLVFENNLDKWEDFFMYDYGINTARPYTFVEMYDVSSTAILEAGVDLAFSRNADYVYMTHRSSQYQLWGTLFDKWAELIDYVAQQNRTLY